MASDMRRTRGRRWTGRENNPQSLAKRRPQQDCPFNPDCPWTADADDHHALAAHTREHQR
jgi:hypothetical protein